MFNSNTTYQEFLASLPKEQQQNLSPFQSIIIQQALSNRGIRHQHDLSREERDNFLQELNNIVSLCGQLPNFVGSDEFEDPFAPGLNQSEIDERNAKNLFKHLTRGIPLAKLARTPYTESFLAHDDILDTLFKQRNPRLLKIFRSQMQEVFHQAWKKLNEKSLSADDSKQYEIFQNNLISSYPFWDPEENEEVQIPQKINDTWQLVSYQFKKFDVSPKSGPLSWILEDEDRMYAYALTPKEKALGAMSHVLLMGTTYPAGQGAGLASIYNFYPHHSVGEGHELAEVRAWLETQPEKSVQVTGHSKGAIMAMQLAALEPKQIQKAVCLNPPAFSEVTLNKFTPKWNQLKENDRPSIEVYAQLGDPVFPLEKGFLPGTKLYRVVPEPTSPAMNVSGPAALPIPQFIQKAYEAHVHIFSGRSHVLFLKMNTEIENNSHRRLFFNDIKYVLNWLRFPLEYTKVCAAIIARKIARSISMAIANVPLLNSKASHFCLNLIGSLITLCAKAIGMIYSLVAHLSALALGSVLFLTKSAANLVHQTKTDIKPNAFSFFQKAPTREAPQPLCESENRPSAPSSFLLTL